MLTNLTLFSFFSLFITDLLIIWFIIEIINFLFIYMLNMLMTNKKMIFFYFIIQISSSFLMIYAIIINNMFNFTLPTYMLTTALLIKLGLPPFHYWFPLISAYLPWNMLFILMTLQKITPFYMMSLNKINNLMLYIILISCSIIPPFITLNLTNFKLILAYSSINQSSWMILLIFFKKIIWFQYFLTYSMILLTLILFIYMFKMFKTSYPISNKLAYLNPFLLIIMFNISGLPPFTLFFMKWYSIFIIMKSTSIMFILIIMMLSSLSMMFIYLNMLNYSLYFYKIETKLIKPLPPFNMKNIFYIYFIMILSLIILQL